MKDESQKQEMGTVTTIYHEFESWHTNLGDKTIHAKRMPGFFRTVKNYTQASLWLPFFLLPYLRWNGKQARVRPRVRNLPFRCADGRPRRNARATNGQRDKRSDRRPG